MAARIAAVVTMLACAAMLAASHTIGAPWSSLFKMAASTAFIATAWCAGAHQSLYGRIILAGLAFSWFGDYFLTSLPGGSFLAGLVSFFIAHVAYCAAYAVRGTRLAWASGASAVLLIPAVLLVRWFWPGVSADLQMPVLAYVAVISLMVALAVGTYGKPGAALIIAGAVAFYLSDIFVARGRFVESDALNGLVGLPLYFGGQVLLALSTHYTRPSSGES